MPAEPVRVLKERRFDPARPAARRPAHPATLLLRQGVPARVAMQVLGHSQINLTLGTYPHVVLDLAEEAAERTGNALWG